MWGLEFNLKHPILSNIKVRHAIAHAINKTKIVEVAYFRVPIVPPNANPIAPIFKWAWNPNATEYEYNPQKAEQLLDEAGYPRGSDGIRFEVTLDFMNYMPGDREMWIMVQEMLNDVGIKVNLREWGDWGSYFDHFMSGNWELNWAWGGPGPDPSGYDRFFLSDATYNKAGYNNTRVDELFAEVTRTFNQTRRQEIFYEIGKILSDDLPRIPIWVVTSPQVWKPEFIGYPDGASLVWYDLANVWWAKGQAISPAIVLEAIQDAKSLIAKLKSEGYDVKNAEKKLNWAKDAFNVGLYELAYSLAGEAKELANQLITAPPYLIYAALIIIIIFAISLAVYWYRRKKS
jgi:peptide/nickel transport system substrate-binding protein